MKLPTAILGYVSGPLLRWNSVTKDAQTWTGDGGAQVNRRPIGPWVVTHLQKQSRCGFLLFWPFIFHVWFFVKKQEVNGDGDWVPGTERGFYARTPGYRYDFADQKYIRTRGFVGGRWD
jgi:hypothetical protein